MNDTLSLRILLAQIMGDIADEIEAGQLKPKDAVDRLRRAAAADAKALDEEDIEIDFDATGPEAPEMALMPLLGSVKPKMTSDDPVENALLKAVRLRDRIHALRIVGDAPGAQDRAAYAAALGDLRKALNAKPKSSQE
jgi:hypothetical protein